MNDPLEPPNVQELCDSEPVDVPMPGYILLCLATTGVGTLALAYVVVPKLLQLVREMWL